MLDSIKNEIIIDEDIDNKVFLYQNNNSENSKHFIVSKGKKLDIVLVDFSSTSSDTIFDVDLDIDSQCNVKVASICYKECNKKYIINIHHNGKNSYSRVSMAGINLGNGSLKFLGNSYIVNGASKSDTRQEGKITNLALDSKSEVSPALYIKENDVKASHGAAVGAYNPDLIYYMMSRGLSLLDAKKLITLGSLNPIIDALNDKKLIEKAKEILEGIEL